MPYLNIPVAVALILLGSLRQSAARDARPDACIRGNQEKSDSRSNLALSFPLRKNSRSLQPTLSGLQKPFELDCFRGL